MEIEREYGIEADIYLPMINANTGQFATSGDWTPVAGDVKIMKDNGEPANLTVLPEYQATSKTWRFRIMPAEMAARHVMIIVCDQTLPAAIMDNGFLIATKGHADSATPPIWGTDLDAADYASGTAGRIISQLLTSQVVVSAPIAIDGVITVYRGDDYLAANGRQLSFTDPGDTWPSLAGATVRFNVKPFSASSADVMVATGAGKQVDVDLASAITAKFVDRRYDFTLVATLAAGEVVTLAAGKLHLANL